MSNNVDPRFEMLCKQSVEDAIKIAKLERENERLSAVLREIRDNSSISHRGRGPIAYVDASVVERCVNALGDDGKAWISSAREKWSVDPSEYNRVEMNIAIGQCRIVEIGEITTSEGRVVRGAIIEFPNGPPDDLTFSDVWDRRAFTLERVAALGEGGVMDTPLKYATRLATSLAHEHWPDNEAWEPLPDLYGVLAQIDNMSTLMRDQKHEIARLRAALRKVIAWEGPLELAAPELGGLLKSMHEARAALGEEGKDE